MTVSGPEGGQFTADIYSPPTDNPELSPVPPRRPQVATLEAVSVGGQLVSTLLPAPAGTARWVNRITVSLPNRDAAVRAYVYVGDVRPENIIMGTRSGQLDVALENPPLFVPEGSLLSVAWDSGPSRALARIEYLEA